MNLRYCETNVHLQCKRCNAKHIGGGEQAKHQDYIIEIHGEKILKNLKLKEAIWKTGRTHFDSSEITLKRIGKYYREKYNDLISGKLTADELYQSYRS